ncbi:hypothetical protein B0H14DRAFT_2622559 [Mycena olivaceomarginata]|nr:hypothetical protein B0H14DRAFT_2622559 [Mycena olivaceomarginata]
MAFDGDIDAFIQMVTTTAQTNSLLPDTRTQVSVTNLPYHVHWQDLKDLFCTAGTVLHADVSITACSVQITDAMGDDYVPAARHYQQAEKLDPTNPVYPSNLSATFFEMGSYTECVSAILRSFSHLDLVAEENAPLASRLSLRLAKSLCQALAAGTPISLDNGIADQIDRIEKVYPVDGPESSAWKIWRTWANDPAKRFETLNLARERLLGLPILKKSPFHAREYYSVYFSAPLVSGFLMLLSKISHDDILSLLEKSSEFEDSSLTGEQDSIDLATFSEAQLSKLAFLFGGVGDARHVFGTVVGLHETLNRLSPKQRKALKVHITPLDVKEHALARDLAAIFFLSKIMSCTDAIDKLELQATLFYFYTEMVMPEYCHCILAAPGRTWVQVWRALAEVGLDASAGSAGQGCAQPCRAFDTRYLSAEAKLYNIIKEMLAKISQDSVHFLPWIHLDSRSVSGIRSALSLWANLPEKCTADYVSQHRYMPQDKAIDLRIKVVPKYQGLFYRLPLSGVGTQNSLLVPVQISRRPVLLVFAFSSFPTGDGLGPAGTFTLVCLTPVVSVAHPSLSPTRRV